MTTVLEQMRGFVNSQPNEADYAIIGKIALQHTGLEYLLESLVWTYMGDIDKGHIATSRLGIQGITDMLQTFVDWTEPDDGVAEAVEWAIDAFHLLRLNRNSIVHGYNFTADRKSGKLFIERRTRSIVFDAFDQFELTPEILLRCSEDQNRLADFLFRLTRAIERRGPQGIGPNLSAPTELLPLPARPRAPEKLTPLPREAPIPPRRQRRALIEKAAKEAKLAKKAEQRRGIRKNQEGELA